MNLRAFIAVLIAVVLGPLAPALAQQTSNFVTLKLARGVTIDAPRTWRYLSADQKQLIAVAAEATADLVGIARGTDQDLNLLKVLSTPASTYAQVTIDSTTPPQTKADVDQVMSAPRALEAELTPLMTDVLRHQGHQLLGTVAVQVDRSGPVPTMTASYRRTGVKGPVVVTLVHYYAPKHEVRISISYRESERALWAPVAEKMRRSVRLTDW